MDRNDKGTFALLQQAAFKSSKFKQAPEVTEYLKTILLDGYNRYCIDCKIKETTHALTTFGIFVCVDCAVQHNAIFGIIDIGMKSIFNS